MSVYRCIAGAKWDPQQDNVSDLHVLSSLGAASAEVLLRRARIMCFIRLCKRGSPYLLKVLHSASAARGSWVSSIVLDLDWLAVCSPELRMQPKTPFPEWCKLVQVDHGVVRRALLSAVARFGHCALPPRSSSRTVAGSLMVWSCEVCGNSFPTRQAMQVHRNRQHWLLSEIRWYLRGTQCEVCALECHTRYHIIEHVAQKSPICRSNYVLRGRRLEPEEVLALDVAETERVRLCRQQSRNPRRLQVPAYRLGFPSLPVLREDGTWVPGDSGHPLGPNRRMLLLPAPAVTPPC